MKYSFALLGAAALVNASPYPRPQAVTAQISPSAPAPSGCTMDYATTFGVVAQNITMSASKPAASQLSDGQPQASTGAVTTLSDGQPQAPTSAPAPVTTISDGQPQAPTSKATSAPAPVSQLSDGQPQASTGKASPVSQISDGQIQGPTATMPAITQIGDGQIQAPTMAPITQIGDGQIQAPTAPAPKPATPISQLSDGQPQAPTKSTAAAPVTTLSDGQPQVPKSTAAPVTSLSDGQPQVPKSTAAPVTSLSDGQPQVPKSTAAPVTSLSDGQPQAPTSASAAPSGTAMPKMVACAGDGVLSMTLKGGVLTDSKGRIGYIAANYQFQFDGPPQAGAIYTSGWSVCGNGSLALGGQTTFYQCLSGDFYNLYNENWAAQCNPVTIDVLDLIPCA